MIVFGADSTTFGAIVVVGIMGSGFGGANKTGFGGAIIKVGVFTVGNVDETEGVLRPVTGKKIVSIIASGPKPQGKSGPKPEVGGGLEKSIIG